MESLVEGTTIVAHLLSNVSLRREVFEFMKNDEFVFHLFPTLEKFGVYSREELKIFMDGFICAYFIHHKDEFQKLLEKAQGVNN